MHLARLAWHVCVSSIDMLGPITLHYASHYSFDSRQHTPKYTMASVISNRPWRTLAVSMFVVLLLSSLASASIFASDKASVASYSAAQIEEELQVNRIVLALFIYIQIIYMASKYFP